jgi:hypothetical protein
MILDHWKQHHPKMVEDLSSRNILQPALQSAELLTTDLLYNLTVEQEMDYQAAWEIATREWAFLPTEAPPESPS